MDIQGLINRPETLFLDFKTSNTTDGRMTTDDKNNFKEALSGFSHQEGGVIIWGINCRPHAETGIDQAVNEAPITSPGDFLTTLNDYFPYTTEPLVDGVQHKLISTNDDPATNTGFIVSLIPKSYKVHRILAHRGVQFYKRYGTSFRPVETTEEIRSLFLRQIAPVLEVAAHPSLDPQGRSAQLSLTIRNVGNISAKHISIQTRFVPHIGMQYYDGSGNLRWTTWTENITGDGGRMFSLNNGFVLHPQQEMIVFTAQAAFGQNDPRPTGFEYTVYAENMEPFNGTASF